LIWLPTIFNCTFSFVGVFSCEINLKLHLGTCLRFRLGIKIPVTVTCKACCKKSKITIKTQICRYNLIKHFSKPLLYFQPDCKLLFVCFPKRFSAHKPDKNIDVTFQSWWRRECKSWPELKFLEWSWQCNTRLRRKANNLKLRIFFLAVSFHLFLFNYFFFHFCWQESELRLQFVWKYLFWEIIHQRIFVIDIETDIFIQLDWLS
jgi:hypothetical protein